MERATLLKDLKEVLETDKEILFAYLYGSYIYHSIHFESDIDVAVYLMPSDIEEYIKKESELTTALIMKLHLDKIDLRILNTAPFLLKFDVINEGMLIFVRDELERVDFETRVMERYFELKPYLEEYRRLFSLRVKAGV